MNVLITTGTDGSVTVHRDTCKKIEGRDALRLEDQIDIDPQKLVTAKKASCCKPSPATIEDVEQAGWDALEKATDAEATDDVIDVTEDLIGNIETSTLVVKNKRKLAPKIAKELAATKEVNGAEALQKVADHLGVDLGDKPAFPGFGRAFKTATKQSIYINSKGSADARAASPAEATEWAALDHVERRAGNYVRVTFGKI